MRVVWLRAVIHSRAPPLPFIEEILKPRAQLQQSAANLMGPSSYTARRSLFLKGCHSPRGAPAEPSSWWELGAGERACSCLCAAPGADPVALTFVPVKIKAAVYA